MGKIIIKILFELNFVLGGGLSYREKNQPKFL